MSYLHNDNRDSGAGLTFTGGPMFLLFLLFLGLRLTDHIDWAWYWIAAPLWIPLGLALVIILVAWVFICWADDSGGR